MESTANKVMISLLSCGRAYVNYLAGAYREYILRNGKVYERYAGNKENECCVGHIDDIHTWDNMRYDLTGVASVTSININ